MKIHPALKVGLGAAFGTCVMGVIFGVVFGQQNPGLGWMVFKRMTLLGAGIGLSSGIARAIQPTTPDGKPIGKDWGSLGTFFGMLLAGYVAQYGLTASVGMKQIQPGEVLQISGPTLTGEQFSLEQYRGKAVLVDFWATWCGPCVAELPNVKATYDRFHDHGLEIVGVSFDQNRQELEEFVKAEQLPWPQIFFDDEPQQGFNNPNGVRYQVDGIPCMMLVDQEGRLISRGLRGYQVQAAVAQLLNVPPSLGERVGQIGWHLLNLLVLGITAARWYILLPAMIVPSALIALGQRWLVSPRKHGP